MQESWSRATSTGHVVIGNRWLVGLQPCKMHSHLTHRVGIQERKEKKKKKTI